MSAAFGLEHSYLSKYQYETMDGSGLRVVHDTRIAVQKPSHCDLIEIFESNVFLLKPLLIRATA